jgi:hypothetical protein
MQAGISDFFKEYIGWKKFRVFLRVIWGLFMFLGGIFEAGRPRKLRISSLDLKW